MTTDLDGTGDRGAVRLRSLELRDFRNLERIDLEVPADGIVVVGDNGHGKTNLLEAIYYLQTFRSVRGARDQDVVRFGADGFFVSATVEQPHGAGTSRSREIAVGYERATRNKRVRLDGQIVERLGSAVGTLSAAMFSPADVELVAGGPPARRRYLDIVLSLTVPGYLDALQRYLSLIHI